MNTVEFGPVFKLVDYVLDQEFKPSVIWMDEMECVRVIETHDKGSIIYITEVCLRKTNALGETVDIWERDENADLPWVFTERLRGGLRIGQSYDPFGSTPEPDTWDVENVRGVVVF